MRAIGIVAVVVVAGCQGYKAGSFGTTRGPFVGETRTVGCLDVAVRVADDPQAVGPAAAITLGNRCDAAVVVDLGALRATAIMLDGSRVRLRHFDPNGEIRPAALEARGVARETIEFEAPGELADRVVEWCVDVGGLEAHQPREQIAVCFAAGVRT